MNQWDDPSMGEKPTRDLYEVLGVSRDATDSEIKRAFHNIARANHPDKRASNTAGDDSIMIEANHAYTVLSNPEQRAIYDEGGDEGLDVQNQLASLTMDQMLLSILMRETGEKMCFLCILALVVIECVVIPLLITLQLDGSLGWSWFGVTTPMWIPLGLSAPVFLCAPCAFSKDYASKTPQEQAVAKAQCLGCVVVGTMVGCFAASVWMACYKADGGETVSWSYMQCTIPLLILEGITALGYLQLLVQWSQEQFYMCLQSLLWKSLRISFYVLLALKLDGASLTWGEVMLPALLWPVISLLLMAKDYWEHRQLKSKSKQKDVTLEEEASRYAPFFFVLRAVMAIGLLLFTVLLSLALTHKLAVSYSLSALPLILALLLSFALVSWALLCFTPSDLQAEYQQFPQEGSESYGTFHGKEREQYP
eukprot:CAMPEP_0181311276 /NCGR_PEP_ID=MMETSP1101-20121128/13047_1 /TAXON_ID=46948 /ORGANISM="Rhodomonas abbreviata, Strain Caron Lab Isolate" /LENGTH=421 /DNA_ID=CAMNT_0023417989 /DNA_START=207 /DNA_END=1472 /DNA_ORIENTATION=+